MTTREANGSGKEDWSRSVLFAILLFLFGDKIVIVGKMIVKAIDAIKGDVSQELYLYEASLLALGIGLGAATLVTIAKVPDAKRDNMVLIAGVFVGALAGLLELSETMVFEEGAAKLAAKPFFFFAIFAGLFLLPALFALMGDYGQRIAIHRLARISAAVVIGLIAGLIVWHVVGGAIWALPIFDYDGRLSGAVDRLTFRPLAFVWMGTVWAVVAFLNSGPGQGDGQAKGRVLWSMLYALSAVVVAALYPVFFVGAQDLIHAQAPIPTWVAFALVGAAPVAACALGGAFQRGIEGMRLSLASCAGFILTFSAMMAGLAHGAGPSAYEKVIGGALFALGGAAVPLTAYWSVIFANRLFANRGGR